MNKKLSNNSQPKRKLLLVTLITCFCLVAAGYVLQSCLPVKCKGVVCLNGGTCTSESCVCPTGYYGPRCDSAREGSITFWAPEGFGSDTITVVFNGQTKLITGFYPAANPVCGNANCANFTLQPGNYNYSAHSSNRTWAGTIAIRAQECRLASLY